MAFTLTEEERGTWVNFTSESAVSAAEDEE
jgi:hypothetical protein